MVRARGLEPPILSEPDPKSGASAIPPRALDYQQLTPCRLSRPPFSAGQRTVQAKRRSFGTDLACVEPTCPGVLMGQFPELDPESDEATFIFTNQHL